MVEASGGLALQEVVLDRRLPQELAARGLSISRADIERERTLLTEAIIQSAQASPADAERLLESVRRSRGLGEERFEALLRRNAAMRKLVAADVQVSEEELAQAFDMRHGPRYRMRVILVPSQSGAAQLREQLSRSQADTSVRFAEAAMRESTDPSASRGGMLEPISVSDPAYPIALRQAAKTLEVGQISAVLGVERGYVIALMEERIPADGVTLQSTSAAITAEVRTKRERLAMDDLARRLLQESQVKVMDRQLQASYRAASGATQP